MLDLIPGIRGTSSALTAERIRMEVTSQNVANALSKRTPDGKPYQRQEVVFQSVLDRAQRSTAGQPLSTLVVARIQSDSRPPRLVPDPSRPGELIPEPAINIHEEMVDYIAASRAYEANLAMARGARAMALQTLSIGRR